MASPTSAAVWWVRRDFRLADNPALRAAIDEGEAVLPLFVLDPVLLRGAGTARKAWLFAALTALDRDLTDAGGPGLSVVRGKPATPCRGSRGPLRPSSVHVSADFGRTAGSGTRPSSRPWTAPGSHCGGPDPRTQWHRAR